MKAKKKRNFYGRLLILCSTALTCIIFAALMRRGGTKTHRHLSELKKNLGVNEELNFANVKENVQRENIYTAYHEARKDRCDGCRYVPFYLVMYSKTKTVFDAGAANCGVMRLLEAKGFEVQGIEYSEWVVTNFCKDFLDEPKRIQIGPIHLATFVSTRFDLVLCTDVLEHIPLKDIPNTLSKISQLAKPGGNVFLVIASDPSKHENHPERSAASVELKKSGLKIHETLKPRSWWLEELLKYGLEEDKGAMSSFLQVNQKTVHDPRYGYSIPNFKNRGYTKVYEPNQRHVDRIYCLKKNFQLEK